MEFKKCWPSFIDETHINKNSVNSVSHQKTICDPQLIYNTIEYRLLRFKLKNELNAHNYEKVTDSTNSTGLIRSHSSLNNTSKCTIPKKRPSTSIPINNSQINYGDNIIKSQTLQIMQSFDPKSDISDSYSSLNTTTGVQEIDKIHVNEFNKSTGIIRKRTPSICISTADELEEHTKTNHLDLPDITDINTCTQQYELNIEKTELINSNPSILSDISLLKVPGLDLVPENNSEKTHMYHQKQSKKHKKKLKSSNNIAPVQGKEFKDKYLLIKNSNNNTRKMALSSTIARTSFQKSSKNCILDPILQKVTVHIRNYKKPAEKVTLSMCYSSSVAGHNSNAISEDIQRLCKRKEALTREKATKVEQRLETQRKRRFVLKDERVDEEERHIRRINRTHQTDDLQTLAMNDATGQRAPLTVHELSSARVDIIRTRSRSIASLDRKEKWYKDIKEKFSKY